MSKDDDFILEYLRHSFDTSAASVHRDFNEEARLIRRSKLELKLAGTLYDDKLLLKWLPNGRTDTMGKGDDRQEYNIIEWRNIWINDKLFQSTFDSNHVSTPLIEFYANIHGISIDEAEIKLLNIFSVSDDFDRDINPETSGIQRMPLSGSNINQFDYFFYDINHFVIGRLGIINSAVDTRLLPISFFQQLKSKCALYIPFDIQRIYNFDFLRENKKNLVILTDSILAAHENQTKARLSRIEVDFVSWIGGIDALSKKALNEFRGRKLYYLIFNHSGFTGGETYRNALAVAKKFEEEGIQLKLVSFLTDVMPQLPKIGYFLGFPRIVNKEALADQDKTVLREPEQKFLKLFQAASCKPTPLLTPIVMPREITIFRGPPLSGKTILSTAMAWAISQGSGLFLGWRATVPKKVLYIFGEQPDGSLWQTMDIHFKTHIKGNVTKIENHISPEDMPLHIHQGAMALLVNLQAKSYPIRKKGVTVDDPIGKTIYYDQFWGISAANQVSGFKIDDWITYTNLQLKLLRDQGHDMSLIVWDNLLELQSLYRNPSDVDCLNDWLSSMQFRGYSVWLIPPGRLGDKNSNRLINALRINNCISVEKIESVNPSDISMSIEVSQSHKVFEKLKNKFSMTLDPAARCPVWHSVETGLTRTKKKVIVKRLLLQGKNGPQIALETGFSLSSVKDLKRALGETTKTPSKAPHVKNKYYEINHRD
ncbi:MAG: hypothetical protein WCI51_04715 [Lentisphaerota bacterium]